MTKASMNIRLGEEILEKLKAQAEKENRSLSNMVETIILEYLARKPQG